MNRACRPVPELVDPRPEHAPYRVRPSREHGGSVDLVQRIMHVPFDLAGRGIVRHELGHVRYSPPRLPRVDFPLSTLQAVEDARINLALAARGLPVELDPEGAAHAVGLACEEAREGHAAPFLLRCVAAVGTSVLEDLLAAGASRDAELAGLARCAARTVTSRLRASAVARGTDEADFEEGVEAARDLARLLRASGIEPPPTLVGHGGASGFAELFPELRKGAGDVQPGRMAVHRVELPRKVRLRPCRRGGARASEEGIVPRAPWRLFLDGCAFRRPARGIAGTVLVDVSGSMGFGEGDVDELVQGTRSALTIAIYSGRGGEGELRVVVSKGRLAAPEDLRAFGRGNIVDLPALEWLARQTAPRIWLSDGGVTGVGDVPSPELTARCRAVCRRARIRRVLTAQQAARALGGPSA